MIRWLCIGVALVSALSARSFEPADLFRVRQVGAIEWSPDGSRVAIELTRPGRALDTTIPSAELAVLDVRAPAMRTLTPPTSELGYFNAVWSPDGKRLAFLSVDGNAVVRPWLWTVGADAPVLASDLDVRVGFGEAALLWLGNDRLAVLAWDEGAVRSGTLYVRILRGRNAADSWRRAYDGRDASVSTLESGSKATPAEAPSARLVALDLATGARTTLARGDIHRPMRTPDGHSLSYLLDQPEKVASYLGFAGNSEAMYDPVNWGTDRHVVELDAVVPALVARPKLDACGPQPAPGARCVSRSPAGDAALFVANAADGTHLWLGAGAETAEVWRANEWMREIQPGRAEPLSYKSSSGAPLTAWLLLPPGHKPGERVPVVTVVYPGATYGANEPGSFSLYRNDFEHPQLFAALGYAVLLPSMPEPKDASDAHDLARLVDGVLPALDAAIARGVADPGRIAVMGQSDGGFATLGLITQTNRFRTAIASASFCNLVSLYGTLYGQHRNGDSGPPQKAQLLRMLQMEKGVFALGGPPWEQPERYRAASPILQVAKVSTPLMLIHGDLDFIPIQQAEEFYTALYRQDKRATLVRYQGEWHTISYRADVLDLWRRIPDWLAETMASRQSDKR